MSILSTGTIGTLNASSDISRIGNIEAVGIVLTGTWTGTITFQGSMDGTNFINMFAMNLSSGLYLSSTTTNGSFLVNTAGFQIIRIKMTSYTSGTATCEAFTSSSLFKMSLSTLVGTDGTTIGNSGDRIKVDSQVSSIGSSTISNTLRYVDMNVSNGGIARNTDISTAAYSTVFSYNGSGVLFGFTVNFEGNLLGADPFTVKLIVDSATIFETTTADMVDGLYDINNTNDELFLGISIVPDKTFRFLVPKNLGMTYSSNVTVQVKKTSGSNKQFRAGLVTLTKVT